MSPEPDLIASLRSLWVLSSRGGGDTDYTLLAEVEGAFAGRSKTGLPALVFPVADVGAMPSGRRAAGCELVGHASTEFDFRDRRFLGPAAALLCIDPDLVDAFVVLALDVAKRFRQSDGSWRSMLALVEEWQSLLAPRGQPNAEMEMGLWGELWFLSRSLDVDALLAGWCGPDGDNTDFFLGSKGAEVKTSRNRHQHFVSMTQVDAPVGGREAWFLSIWVKPDPVSSTTVATLGEGILSRVANKGDALRRLLRAGYSPSERNSYATSFTILDEPEWFAAPDVPRVRAVDAGVSHLRYRVALDGTRRAETPASDSLWRHFNGRLYLGD